MANANDVRSIRWYYYDEHTHTYMPFTPTPEASSTTIQYGIETFSERMKRLQKEKAEREQFEREMAEFCEWDQQED